MSSNIYTQLASFLDNLPGGFPSTESGVELKILQRLFNPEEAELAMHLALIDEPAKVIAYRAGKPVKYVAEIAGADGEEGPGLRPSQRRKRAHLPGNPLCRRDLRISAQ